MSYDDIIGMGRSYDGMIGKKGGIMKNKAGAFSIANTC